MQRLDRTATLFILGLSLPLLTHAISPIAAVAWDRDPSGSGYDHYLGAFSNGESTVCVDFKKDLHYYLTILTRGNAAKTISLRGAAVSQTAQLETYTWSSKSGIRYQVIWKPKDPQHIRLLFRTPNGRETVKQLSSIGICQI
jgi:hypothetical protein